MPTENISVNAAQFKCIQSNAHQCGLLSRASRALIQCTNIHTVNQVLKQTLADLDLSGFYAFKTEQLKAKQYFGDALTVEEQAGSVNLLRNKDKISYSDRLFCMKSDKIIVLARFTSGTQEAIVELGRDNLAILIDTVHTWLEMSESLHSNRKQAFNEKLSSADKLNEVLGYLKVYNTHLIESNREIYKQLLSSMVSQFPLLGLEGDQEEAILDIIDQAQEKQESILDAQINYNDDLTNILNELIGNLINDIDDQLSANKDPRPPSGSVELF